MKRESMSHDGEDQIIELLTRIAASLESLERCVEGNMVRTHPDAY